jgi:hypothetical protein
MELFLPLGFELLTFILGVIAATGLQLAWYSPYLFGKIYRSHKLGIPTSTFHKSFVFVMKIILAMTLLAFVQFHLIKMVAGFIGTFNPLMGVLISFWLWLGFVVPTLALSTSGEIEPEWWRLFAVESSSLLASMLVLGALLSV